MTERTNADTLLAHQRAVEELSRDATPPTMPLRADEWDFQTVWDAGTTITNPPKGDGWWLIATHAVCKPDDAAFDVFVYARCKEKTK